jgi:TolA-binding protein
MKSTTLTITGLLLLLGIAAHVPANAQSSMANSATRSSAEPLAEIADALGRIADMLERQAEGARLDLLMKRVDASNRRLGQLESRLRTARSDYDQARENQTRLETQSSSMEEQAAAENTEEDYLHYQRLHLETEMELGRQRLAALGDSIAELENEIASRSRDVEDWQAYVDRELSGLD